MGKKELVIYIGGVPPGVRVGVFDLEFEKGNTNRPIILEEVGVDSCIYKKIPSSYGQKLVKVVIRCAGYLPYEYTDTIEQGIGLFHAAYLHVDNVYQGTKHYVSPNWNATEEHRKAERKVQSLYRKFRKDNSKARYIKFILDYGTPIICAGFGFILYPIIGSILGLLIGLIVGQVARRLAGKAMGWD